MRIHVIGVSGTAMGSLAGLLADLGHEVSGSDVRFDPPMGPLLESWGVRCLAGFDPSHLSPRPDLVVVGNVCRKDNPEARAAIDGKMRYTHVAGALDEFVLAHTRPLVVAGTHGKTTTASLAAWLLEGAGRKPGFLIGGVPKNFGRSFRTAEARRLPIANTATESRLPLPGAQHRAASPFVLEGDEYDTAFFEKTAKFLHYPVDVAIVTSIEHDHIDIYPTVESYEAAFSKFVARVPEDGLVVANAMDPAVVRIVSASARADVAWYAFEDRDTPGVAPRWIAAPAMTDPGGTSFDLFLGGSLFGRIAVPLVGRHNVENTLAALAAVVEGYGVPLHELVRPLAAFSGVKRRQELLGEPGGVSVIDDFAHHPTAVRETLSALRAAHPAARLFAVFEPRSATACRALHQEEYGKSFADADDVLIAPLGRSGLAEDERLDTDRLATVLRKRGKRADAFSSTEPILDALVREAKGGDVVALLSNGAFDGIHERLLRALAQRA